MIIDSEAIKRKAKEQRLLASHEKQKSMVKAQKARDNETFRNDAGRSRLDQTAQFGRPLRSSDIQKRLRTLIPGVRFEVSNAMPSRTGIYKGDKFLTAMETGVSPEFSVMAMNGEFAVEAMRGWRTILANLIKSRCITIREAEDTFDILRGAQSERWWEATAR
jgi:hypothetical protein